jgi:hypothetical protein
MIRKKIQKRSRPHGEVATLSDKDGVDFFDISGIECFEHRRQATGRNVFPNLKDGKARKTQPGERQTMQGFTVAGLCVSSYGKHGIRTFVRQGPAGLGRT